MKLKDTIINLEIKKLYKNDIDKKILDIEYNFIEKNEELIYRIKNEIKELNSINYKKFKSISIFEELLKKEFLEDNILNFYISIFIVKSFNSGLDEIKEKKYRTIHDNINSITKSIQNLNIFIKKENNMEQTHINEKEIYEFFLKIINFLETKKIIDKILHIDKKEKKTRIMLVLKNLKQTPYLEIYQNKFELLDFGGKEYLISKTFNSIREVNSVNSENNSFKTGDKKFLGNLLSKKMYIDHEILEYINKEYKKEHNIKSNNIIQEYTKIINEHANFVKENDDEGIKESSKLISIFQKALLFEFLIENKIKHCFAPIFIDFRGRVYKGSSFSVTFVKELRICIYFGYYDNDFFENYIEGKTDKILNKYIHLLDDIEPNMNIEIILKRSILWYLIGLSENIKSKLGKEINIETLIKEGIKIYKDKSMEFEYEKKIKIMAYCKGIDMLLKEDRIKISPISKDATASVYQQLVKILGGRDDNIYRIANLKSENTLYDIYTFIIEDWREKHKKKIEEIDLYNMEKYFNRKNLKKIMMTKNYGCGFTKCLKYFIEDIEKDEILQKEIKIKINKLIYSFYKFITDEISLTDMNLKEIDKFLEEIGYNSIKLADGSIVDLRYYKKNHRRIDTKVQGKRYTNLIKFKSEEIDWDKMRIAGPANYVHMQDGAVARDVSSIIICLIIHDCYIVGCLDVSKLVDTVNKCMNRRYHIIFKKKKYIYIYSIFIVV